MYWIIFFGILILDRITKYIATSTLDLYQLVQVIPKFLYFTYVQNTGAAFSFFQGRMPFLLVFTAMALFFVLYLWRSSQPSQKLFRASLAMLAAGAVGNFIDRLFYSYVIDFIHVPFFATFNVADIFVVFAVILILWNILFSKERWFR